MLTLDSARTEFRSLPLLVHVGLAILLIGGVADIAAHLEVVGHAGDGHEHTASELSAHLIGFVGMVVILLGVVTDGVRQAYLGHSVGDFSRGGM
jgi:hypothetical protein